MQLLKALTCIFVGRICQTLAASSPEPADANVEAASAIISLNDQNVDLLRNSLVTTEWVILFYADWCGACKTYKPTFHDYAVKLQKDHPLLKVAAMNYVSSPLTVMRFGITHLPAIFHVRDGQFRDITPHRSRLDDYFSEQAWQKTPPLSFYQGPFSLYGSVLAYLGFWGYKITELLGKIQALPKKQQFFVVGTIVSSLVLLFVFLIVVESRILGYYWRKRLEKTKNEKSD